MSQSTVAAKKNAPDTSLHGLATMLQPLDAVFDMTRNHSVVLFGEASHGTEEFYHLRCEVTKRLITEAGCLAVCLESDFPETCALHRYVMGSSTALDAIEALEPFRHRFPLWMWRNHAVVDFLEWLRAHNATLPAEKRTGVWGLDLYSMQHSMEACVAYLADTDPMAASELKKRFACFDTFRIDGIEPQLYGAAVARHHYAGCRAAVLSARRIVTDSLRAQSAPRNGVDARDEAFFAEVDSRVVADAERYYVSMFQWDDSSWNLRDAHMDDTLYRVRSHLRATRGGDRVVVWAHNSHVGDASATGRAAVGETNLGALARQSAGRAAVVCVGQFTHTGTVTAAQEWGEPHAVVPVNPSLAGSWEAAMHDLAAHCGRCTFCVDLRRPGAQHVLRAQVPTRLERAIGVIYRPDTERQSHYFNADLAQQFDVAVWWDATTALRALDPGEEQQEPPGTPDAGIGRGPTRRG